MAPAPFYDIVNITLYKEYYETDLAMGIDDEFVIEKFKPYDFFHHCKILDIKPKVFLDSFTKISSKIVKALNDDEDIISISHHNLEFFNIYKNDILQRVEKLTETLKSLP